MSTAPSLGSLSDPRVWSVLSASRFEGMNALWPLEGTCPFSSHVKMDKCEARVLDMPYGSLNYPGGLWPGEEGEEHSHRSTLP